MKQFELSIGDWVLFDVNTIECDPNHSKERFIPYKIKSTEDLGRLYRKNGEDIYCPMPISQNVLERNGFVFDRLLGGWIDETNRVMLSMRHPMNTNRKWFVHIDNEDMDSIGTFEIDYMHQLQHLLRIAEIYCEFDVDETEVYTVGSD